MTSKSLESTPTRLAPLVDPHPMPSTHNNIYRKKKNTNVSKKEKKEKEY
jgi:hypothetical protein